MTALWYSLPISLQDALVLLALLLPVVLPIGVLSYGLQPYTLVAALLRRHIALNTLFTLLIAVSVGIGVGLIAQERGLREASANATDRFDLVIGAPGSEVTLLMSSVYLQPADVGLIDGALYAQIEQTETVDFVAPLAFGDSYQGLSIIGTTARFVQHLSPELVAGRGFARYQEAVIGSAVSLPLGHIVEPAHGHGAAAQVGAHAGAELVVVGQMAPTGTPWDRAILVPVESVWETHGLGTGHDPDHAGDAPLGGPFEAAWFPGTPAAVVIPTNLYSAYALREQFTTAQSMAILPGAVLSNLHGLMGDVRGAMSLLTLTTQALVALAVLGGIALLIRLFARPLALIRAMGAPDRFLFAVAWLYAMSLVVAGCAIGMGLALGAGHLFAHLLSQETGLHITVSFGWAELHLVAGFAGLCALATLLIAALVIRQPSLATLRN